MSPSHAGDKGAAEPRLLTLFITGFGRSGTTILDSLLGQAAGAFSGGELHYIWDRSFGENRLCACGNPFAECPVWRQIVARAYPEDESDGLPDVERLTAIRDRFTPRHTLAQALRDRPLDTPAGDYVAALAGLYRAIRETTGCQAVIDSSKAPGHGYLLSRTPSLDPRVVHMVRDPRAVAWSWQKQKVYDPSGEQPMLMSRHTPARSARLWTTWNLATELLWRRHGDRYLRLRYEDFARDPRAHLTRILEWIGLPPDAVSFAGDGTVTLQPTHAVAGNPSRFSTGPVTVKPDEAWRDQMPAGQRRLVTLLTWPLMRRYGYPITS
ncbi:MAG: sulfotransferase family protein [Thermoanaerobaculia bacterium]